MTQVNRGIGKIEVGLIICVSLVGVLSVSSFFLFLRNSTLQDRINTLDTEANILQSQVYDLTGEKNVLQNEVDSLNTENDDLQTQVDLLETENEDLQSEKTQLEGEVSSLESQLEYLQWIAEENSFDFYYASLAEQRFGVDDLAEYLDRWQWIDGTYVEGVFDCSEMSAYIEWKLENEGYNTIIVAGTSPWGGGYHAWLLVETSEGHYMPVEATEYDIVYWSDPYFDNYFIYDHQFETIQDALEYSYEEFDWWL